MKKIKLPPANNSPQAIKLREEALLYAENAHARLMEEDDYESRLRNKRLLDAAVAYARVVVPGVGSAQLLFDMARLLKVMMNNKTTERELLEAFATAKKHLGALL